MPLPCQACVHPKRSDIDGALLAGESSRAISKRFPPLSNSAIHRHRAHIRLAVEKAEAKGAETNVVELERLYMRARQLGDDAAAKGDIRAALISIRELARLYELQARLTAQAKEDARDVALHPVWLSLSAEIMGALTPYPDALLAVSRRIRAKLGVQPEVQLPSLAEPVEPLPFDSE